MTRRRSPIERLSRALAMYVTLAFIVMVAASTLVMHSRTLGNMGSELHRLAQRAGEHLDADDTPDPKVEGGDADADIDGDDNTRTTFQSSGRGPHPGGPVILGGPAGPSFGKSGISEGILRYVNEDGEVAGAVISNFSVKYLDERALTILVNVPTDGAPHTARLKGLGMFRVTSQVVDGKAVLVGVQMDSVDDVIFVLVTVEVGLSLVIATAVGFVGRAWVHRELHPLGVVRTAATDIASRDLAGDAEKLTRVGEEATSDPVGAANAAGALNPMIGAIEDGMKHRARSEVKLRQFVADASHELRTPLASVQGYAQLTRHDIDNAPRAQVLEHISSEGTRMASLVEEMPTLARLDGDRVLKWENVDVIPLILSTLSDAHVVTPDHVWALDGAIDMQVLGDEAALRQILTNPLTNARVHIPAGIHMTVSLTCVPRGAGPAKGAPASSIVALRVANDGPGIPAEIRDRIFDRSMRDSSSRTRDGRSSSGLGMSIVESLARAVGGAVRLIDSEKGTVIDVTLPAT